MGVEPTFTGLTALSGGCIATNATDSFYYWTAWRGDKHLLVILRVTSPRTTNTVRESNPLTHRHQPDNAPTNRTGTRVATNLCVLSINTSNLLHSVPKVKTWIVTIFGLGLVSQRVLRSRDSVAWKWCRLVHIQDNNPF